MATIILPSSKNISGVHRELAQALGEKGFFQSRGVLADRYYRKGDTGSQSFFIYNRGLDENGLPNSKSNFNVCVLDTGSRLRVWFSNPDESVEAAKLDYKKFAQFFSFSSGRSGKFVADVADSAFSASLLKPENAYRIFIHSHLAELSGVTLNSSGKMYDDGCSSDGAYLYNIALNHGDLAALTSHNNFLTAAWKKFAAESAKYGVNIIPGFEATLPIFQHEPWLNGSPEEKTHNPNGPHTVLLFKSPEAAGEFWSRHFSGRKQYKYAPTASFGAELMKIYDEIEGRYRGEIARMVAHPVCEVTLPDVGIANRVAKGEITFKEMEGIIVRSQGVACFNMTLDETPLNFNLYREQVDACSHFDAKEKERRQKNISEAQSYFASLLEKHSLGSKFTPNNVNMALAKEFKGKTISYVDTDSHNFDWGYTDAWIATWMIRSMGLLSQGHNTLWLPAVPAQKPTAGDIVSYLNKPEGMPEAKWSAHIFSEMKDGLVKITDARQDSTWTQNAFNWFEKLYYLATKQVPRIASDTVKSLSEQSSLHDPLAMLRSSIPGTIPK
ncbi:MAG: hypothetical protein WCT52_05940 [Candidatus Micrarchaeia archaeon]